MSGSCAGADVSEADGEVGASDAGEGPAVGEGVGVGEGVDVGVGVVVGVGEGRGGNLVTNDEIEGEHRSGEARVVGLAAVGEATTEFKGAGGAESGALDGEAVVGLGGGLRDGFFGGT